MREGCGTGGLRYWLGMWYFGGLVLGRDVVLGGSSIREGCGTGGLRYRAEMCC